MLDAVPYHQLAAYIHAFQCALPHGVSAMLGFSTLGPTVQSGSPQAIFASIPFLPRKNIKQVGTSTDLLPSSRRSLVPLLATLNEVLDLLTSLPSPLVIASVQNFSDGHAQSVEDYVEDLTYVPSVRKQFVSEWGMDGWREERLLGSWEAALFKVGILTRWLILVRK